jgi:hypothetical protein
MISYNIIRYDIHRWYHRPRGSHGGPNVSSVPTWLQGVQRRPAVLPWVYEVSQGGFRMLCASYVLALVRFAAKKAMDAPRGVACSVLARCLRLQYSPRRSQWILPASSCSMYNAVLWTVGKMCRPDALHHESGGWVGGKACAATATLPSIAQTRLLYGGSV